MSHLGSSLGIVALAAALAFGGAEHAAAAGCPTSVRFEPTANGTLDVGWTGINFDQPILGPVMDFAISCPASSPPCGTCDLTAVVGPVSQRRCVNDSSVACSPATEMTDCGGLGLCRTFLAPPTSLGVGGLPYCYTAMVDGAVSGTVDVESGAFAPIVPIRADLRDGVFYDLFNGGPMQGCPRCIGDLVPNNGVRDGTCDAGPRAGLGCDTNGVSALTDFGYASYDCPHVRDQFTVTMKLGAIAGSTSPSTITLGPGSPPCVGKNALCFCSTCNDAAGEPCADDGDCPMSGGNPGVCNGKRCLGGANVGAPCSTDSVCPGSLCGRPGEPTNPNGCVDDTTTPGDDCVPVGGGRGECASGPVSLACTNQPDRACNADDDCDGVPGACAVRQRACYLDHGVLGGSVSVDAQATAPVGGVAEPTDLGSLACIGPSRDGFFNAVNGLPGLARTHQPGRLIFDPENVVLATPTPIPTSTPTPLPSACPTTADAACRTPTVTGKSKVQIVDRASDAKDLLAWQWSAGSATTVAELGDPTTSTEYDLCLYDPTGLRAAMRVPAGGLCHGKSCWRARATGFIYRNRDGAPDGITSLSLRAGPDGTAQMKAKGSGSALPLPAVGTLDTELQLQLRNRSTGLCFGTTFAPPFDAFRPLFGFLRDRAD